MALFPDVGAWAAYPGEEHAPLLFGLTVFTLTSGRADWAEAGTLGWREGGGTKRRTVVGVVAVVGISVACKGSCMALLFPEFPDCLVLLL